MKTKKTTRRGILAGGNWIIDQVKLINVFPHPETLSNISSESRGTGGAPYNVLINLAKLGAKFPLSAAGLVGADELGKEIVRHCRSHKIDTKQLTVSKDAATSYTDVMTEIDSGRRTFFHFRGANAEWTGKKLDFDRSKARFFHLGYLLLLDAMDQPDKRYGTNAAALLARAQRAGLKTSVDVVSEDSDRFSEVVTPALRYTDYCILNEVEASKTTGFKVRGSDDELDAVAIKHAAGELLQAGIRETVVIHFPEGAFARTKDGVDVWQSSLKLPAKYIKGSAGAGDAFCAGVLMGIHEGWDLQKSLFTGVCSAAASLADPTCTGGVVSLEECQALAKKYRPRPRLDKTYYR
ncbi:MAG: putative sugar kinase YdjH [Verrucomicrobia subdivision 3 bacterium]|nr:putative sugar kinase YdjH [Limisphaerales bacterium]MCS1414259.1 putative sugar kinase YdjH [Limisphaerales bacterium]